MTTVLSTKTSHIAAATIDELITDIVNVGHPKARRLVEDYELGYKELRVSNPSMTKAEAKFETLKGILELAYGIHYVASLADRISMEAADGLAEDDAEAILQAANGIRAGDVSIVA